MAGPPSLAVAVLAAGALAVAACGSLAAPSGPGAGGVSAAASSGPQRSSPAPAEATGSCAPAAVQISLDTASYGVAAGSAYVPLDIENVSASPCSLPSYPAVTLAAGAGGPVIGAPAARQDPAAVQAVVLAPGQLAHAWLQIISAANYPPASCQPVTAAGLLVGLASRAQPSFVADSVPACAHLPGASSLLSVFPVRAGQAQRGTMP
jgi:hypothetical protein